MLNVLVIDELQRGAEDLGPALVNCGHNLAAVLPASSELAAQIEALNPELLMVQTDSPSVLTLQQLAAINRSAPRPVVIFARTGTAEVIRAALQAGASAYIVDGLDPQRVGPIVEVAMARFEAQQALRRELDDANRKLSERKLVDRAKGVLMKARSLDEESAYKALRKLSMDRGQPLAAVAADVIDMARLLL